ncbi:endonuclease/exonuclease/phosphatase family protein [Streptomyces sp. NPDC093546]|uniref:endonuclease/exonuclease/phosphatase family protein n=1 Tax=Streptomyces sp. NPDC093546 TaxID=3366040 RepID=UPI0038233701
MPRRRAAALRAARAPWTHLSSRPAWAPWVVALLLAAPTLVAVCRLLDTDAVTPVPQLLSFLPWLTAPAACALLVALAARRPVLVGWGAATLAVTTWYVQPYGPDTTGARDRPVVTAGLRVLAANVEFGEATRELLRVLRRERPDLAFVSECDPACVRVLSAAYPYRAQVVGPGSAGSVILGAYPLTPRPALPSSLGMPAATAHIGGRDVRLRLAHPLPPLPGQVAAWKRELGLLRDDAARQARSGDPLLLAGDFNASQDHAAFRAVLDAGGLHDAARLAGHARTPTWPREGPPLPPFVQIDHVLVGDDFSVRGARVLDVPGSDHRAVLVDLDLRARP